MSILLRVSGLVKNYLETHTKESINSFAIKCNANRESISKLLSGDLKIYEMKIQTLHKIIEVSTDGSIDTANEICKSDPILKKKLDESELFLSKIEKCSPSNKIDSLPDNPIPFIFKNEFRQRVFILCCNWNGTSEEDIKKIFGDSGLFAMKELLEREIIKRSGEKIISRSHDGKSTIILDDYEIKSLIDVCRDSHIPNHFTRDENLDIHQKNQLFVSQSVTIDFLKELSEKTAAYKTWILDNINKPKNLGNIPSFICAFFDTFITNTEDIKNRNINKN